MGMDLGGGDLQFEGEISCWQELDFCYPVCSRLPKVLVSMQQFIFHCVLNKETLFLKEKQGYIQDWKFQLGKFDKYMNFLKQDYL